jgi:outer membrane protein assembly factor BamE (lipoprotein component of BamABCDE complex)
MQHPTQEPGMWCGAVRKAAALAALAGLSLTAGCVFARVKTGFDFPTAHVDEIRDGTTTRKDIQQWFGTPFASTVREGSEVWVYSVTRVTARGVVAPFLSLTFGGNTQKVELSVTFDEKGVVTDHLYTVMGPPAGEH